MEIAAGGRVADAEQAEAAVAVAHALLGQAGDQPLDAGIVRSKFTALAEEIAAATGETRTPQQVADGFLRIAVALPAAMRLPGTSLHGVTVAFALVALPAPERNYPLIAVAAALGAGLIGLSFYWRRIPQTTQLVVPLGFLALATLLRISDGGAASGFGGLYFLPIVWLALSGDRRELVIGLVGLVLVEVVPVFAIGAPD